MTCVSQYASLGPPKIGFSEALSPALNISYMYIHLHERAIVNKD